MTRHVSLATSTIGKDVVLNDKGKTDLDDPLEHGRVVERRRFQRVRLGSRFGNGDRVPV
jgi:hypothetical protein